MKADMKSKHKDNSYLYYQECKPEWTEEKKILYCNTKYAIDELLSDQYKIDDVPLFLISDVKFETKTKLYNGNMFCYHTMSLEEPVEVDKRMWATFKRFTVILEYMDQNELDKTIFETFRRWAQYKIEHRNSFNDRKNQKLLNIRLRKLIHGRK